MSLPEPRIHGKCIDYYRAFSKDGLSTCWYFRFIGATLPEAAELMQEVYAEAMAKHGSEEAWAEHLTRKDNE